MKQLLCLAFAHCLSTILWVDDPKQTLATRPIPRVQTVPLPHHVTSFQLDGRELTACHFDPADRRVFWYPLRAAGEASLTRMGHPHDPMTHSHHNSVWIAHANVDGVDFWSDHGKNLGRIRNSQIPRNAYDDGDRSASMVMINHWIRESDSSILMVETRRTELMPLDGEKSWLMIVDLDVRTPNAQSTRLAPSPFGMIAVRMAKSIGVHDGAGRILNSDGAVNEQEVFRKPAKWCDYSGRYSNATEGFGGVTLMNHSINPNHPCPFHVRDDGWMGACVNLNESIDVSAEKPLRLRYALWVHERVKNIEDCDKVWQLFHDLPIPALTK